LSLQAATAIVRYFLDNVFRSVMALMVGLGVLLIYSLLLNDVQQRTYEYGMLRMLGMKQRTLIQVNAQQHCVLGPMPRLFW
jgi:ABC-type antimicrobial peptide transport system permease subunit